LEKERMRGTESKTGNLKIKKNKNWIEKTKTGKGEE
jgi:hypothetical protein